MTSQQQHTAYLVYYADLNERAETCAAEIFALAKHQRWAAAQSRAIELQDTCEQLRATMRNIERTKANVS